MNAKRTIYFSESMIKELPNDVCEKLKNLSIDTQVQFLDQYFKKSKSHEIAYCFMLLGFASHYLYVKKYKLQLLFWLTGGGLLVWFVIDMFRVKNLVSQFNRKVAFDVLEKTVTNQ